LLQHAAWGGLWLAAAGEKAVHRERGLREARRAARRILRERAAYAPAYGDLLRAGIAAQVGDREDAAASQRRGLAATDETHMAGSVGLMRWRLGELLGGDEGAALLAAANAWFAREGVVDPARYLDVYAPGFPGG
jgi:hypothetical protein